MWSLPNNAATMNATWWKVLLDAIFNLRFLFAKHSLNVAER